MKSVNTARCKASQDPSDQCVRYAGSEDASSDPRRDDLGRVRASRLSSLKQFYCRFNQTVEVLLFVDTFKECSSPLIYR